MSTTSPTTPAPAQARGKDSVIITRLSGGGESWWYALRGGRIIDAADEDDSEGMQRLTALKSVAADRTATKGQP